MKNDTRRPSSLGSQTRPAQQPAYQKRAIGCIQYQMSGWVGSSASWARPLNRVGLTMADKGRGSLSDCGWGLLILAPGPQGYPLDFAFLPRRFPGAKTSIWVPVNRRAEGEVLYAETET